MSNKVKEYLLKELQESPKLDNLGSNRIKNLLAYSLSPYENDVFDAMEGRFGNGFAQKSLTEDKKRLARKKARINPMPTEKMKKAQELELQAQELNWDFQNAPDIDEEVKTMKSDISASIKETELKNLSAIDSYKEFEEQVKEYKVQEKLCKEGLRALNGYMKEKDMHKVNEQIAALKINIAQLQPLYEEIMRKYEEVCSEVESMIERTERGRYTAGLKMVEKEGRGMLYGENGELYDKRIRSIKRGIKIPETIKGIDKRVAEAEQRWKSVAGLSLPEFETVKENWRKTIDILLKRTALASNCEIIGVNEVLEKWLKSVFEESNEKSITKGSNREDDLNENLRAIVSRKCFGTPKGMKAGQYEKYGCLHMLFPSKTDKEIARQYGGNVIRWKPYYTVATMLCTDSLCLAKSSNNYVTPCLVTNPSPCCFYPENKMFIDALRKGPLNIGLEMLCRKLGTPYIELQLHGSNEYNAEAVESIALASKEDLANLSNGAKEKIKTMKIPIYIEDEVVSLESEGENE